MYARLCFSEISDPIKYFGSEVKYIVSDVFNDLRMHVFGKNDEPSIEQGTDIIDLVY